nr:potassium channel family protein [Saccharopolyspora sp. HNM0983]
MVAALYLAVLFFASVYFGLSWHYPGAMAQLGTRTDALYFALSVTATVGFGDVHAASQGARAVVAVHMVFNIGFLGAVINELRGRITPR